MDYNGNKPPAQANPTGRSLPSHGRHKGSGAAARSAFATVEGPIHSDSMVTQRFERNDEGRYERQIAGALLLATNAIVERGRGGDTVRVDVGPFDALWARYDAGDYGDGDATTARYEITADGAPLPVLLVDVDREQHPDEPRPTRGPQRILPGLIAPLATERLDLEPLTVVHAGEMVAVLADPAIYAFTGGEPPGLEQLRARYAYQATGMSSDGHEHWLNWVVRERVTGRAVGFVQATIEIGTGVADVAWVVTPSCQGRGLAREAAAAMVAWLREDERTNGITAHVHPEHHASGAVAAAVGLEPTARSLEGEVRWELPG